MTDFETASNKRRDDVGPEVVLSALFADNALDFIRPASQLSLDWYRSGRDRRHTVENKVSNLGGPSGHEKSFDPVTEADRMVERHLRDEIEERYPDHGIVGEEFGAQAGSANYSWIIDPIDGTRAFIVGQPMWGTLVGLLDDGRPIGGWMHIPTLDESYIGLLGAPDPIAVHRIHGGVSGQDTNEVLAVSEVRTLGDAIMASTHPDMFDDEVNRTRFEALRSSVKMTRFGGDCLNYGLLAGGLVDLVVENGLAPYDIAPLVPIIEAAGGVVSTLDGTSAAGGGYIVAAATDELHQAAIAQLTAR